MRAAAEYMLELDFDAVHAHEEALLDSALDGLGAMDHVTLYGAAADRAPTLMFTVAGIHPTDVAKRLDEREIAVWDGNYYAWELERVLGLAPHGGIRAGFLHYNDASDAERLLAAVAELPKPGLSIAVQAAVRDAGVRSAVYPDRLGRARDDRGVELHRVDAAEDVERGQRRQVAVERVSADSRRRVP